MLFALWPVITREVGAEGLEPLGGSVVESLLRDAIVTAEWGLTTSVPPHAGSANTSAIAIGSIVREFTGRFPLQYRESWLPPKT
jgi:hypothetical protein